MSGKKQKKRSSLIFSPRDVVTRVFPYICISLLLLFSSAHFLLGRYEWSIAGIISVILAICLYFERAANKAILSEVQNLIRSDTFASPSGKSSAHDWFMQGVSRVNESLSLSQSLLPSAGAKKLQRSEAIELIFSTITNFTKPSAVQLVIYENRSSLSARSHMLGAPTYLNGERDFNISGLPIEKRDLVFAGQNFGELYLEFSSDQEKSQMPTHTFDIVAQYAAILLMNADFERELSRLRGLGEESQQARTGFLATMSHELRGPLGVILNSIEIMMDGLCGEITAEQKETLRMVKDSSNHLMDLVNDVLDYAKVESGSVQVKTVDIALADLLSDLAAVVRSQAIGKDQKLTVEAPDERLAVSCDKRHVRQMLINLLTNAIKYTPHGGKIHLSVEQHGTDSVKILVADTGVGIPESQRDKVFEAFERVDNQYAQQQVGTGLGMPLTRKLAEANNGYVDFISRPDGTTFWLELPATVVTPVETEEHDGTPKVLGNGEQLLLVEPDDEQRIMFEKSLNQRGFAVTAVSSAADVMKKCRTNLYSAILIETDLPDLRGEELVQSIRSFPTGAGIPIIVMSGKAFNFDVEHFLKLGVDRCLTKPFSLVELAATVKRLIDESALLQSSQEAMH